MRENETNPGESVLALDSDIAELERLKSFIDAFCKVAGVPKETCYQLQVVLEELVLNIIKYGGCDPKRGAIQLVMRREKDELYAVLSDRGISFNPLEAPSPDLTSSIHNRPLGGLGIHIVRSLMQSVRYERREGQNYLYLVKAVNPDSRARSPEGGTHASGNGVTQS